MAPRATYRLQLGPNLSFAQAADLAPYLVQLGISHVYLSPHLQAGPGSTHGYDVVDHSRVSEELGGAEAHARMLTTFAKNGLSVVIDVVPNHMSIAKPELNVWWWDVLEKGRDSRWASFFDVDWDHPHERLGQRVLLPVLGDQYGRVLSSGDITLERQNGRVVVRVYDQVYPSNQQPEGDLAALNADKARLHTLLEQQHYRLAYWKSARYDLDYRRFFDVNELVGLRMDRPEVFEATHALLLRWVDEGLVTGLRIDHPDGLVDPQGYLARLRARAPHAWIVVEKILAYDEALPADWPVQGTTGYDFANRVCGLWIDGASAEAFDTLYREATGVKDARFEPVALVRKRRMLREVLAADVRRVVELFYVACDNHLDYRDTSRDELRRAVENLLVALPVYRTYVRSGEPVSAPDRELIATMVDSAKASCSDCDSRLFDFLATILMGEVASADEAMRRFQQLSGPVTAKGVEDTAFFDHHRFIALNDVGNDPDRFGTTAADFHAHNLAMFRASPLGMLATSTHDSKRSEDVRARLAVLSEVPEVWRGFVERLRGIAGQYRTAEVDAGTEYHLYQTLVGAWPIDATRLAAYLEKAMREAKAKTSWLSVNAAYEKEIQEFAKAIIGDAAARRELEALLERIGPAAERNALAQKLLTLTSPGVPDIYQGSERFFIALTDPDNRRAVAFDAPADIKVELVKKTLAVRRQLPECFDARGTYTPLYEHEPRLVAYRRGEHVLVVAQRLRMTPLHVDIDLPEGSWENVLTGERVSGRIAAPDLALFVKS